MFRLAVKSFLAKKRRLFSTALSVILGIAFLSGTLVFTDTIRRTFDDLFADIYDSTDTYVRSSTSVDMQFGMSQRGRIPDTLVTTVRSVPGVAEAQGVLEGYAQLVGADGKALGNPGQGAPTLGMSYTTGELSPWHLLEGSRTPGPDELVIDRASARKGHLELGDIVTVLTQTGAHPLSLVGIARFGSVDSPGGASVALFDLRTAQQLLLGGSPELDAVMVGAAPGVSEAELTARVAAVLPSGVEAMTGSAITAETQSDVAKSMGFFNTFLMVFAAIGLIVACFTIYNTFQIIVTQRGREMALLRAVGATRAQVLWAQLFEAVLVGVGASVVGLFSGVAVASGLKAMLRAFGIEIPAGGTVFAGRTAVVALVVGTLVTVVSAVFPSLRASRVPPIAAIRDLNVDVQGQSRRRLFEGAGITVLGIAAFVIGLAASKILWVGIGALLVFVGAFVVGPLLARPAVRAMGAPISAVSGITGELARENALRNPKRTSRTGGALMIGVALVAGITVIAASVKDWMRDVIAEQFTGDFVVTTETFGFGGLSPDFAKALNQLPEVATATGIRVGAATVTPTGSTEGSDKMFVAVDPATVGKVFDLGLTQGAIETLTPNGVFLDDGEAAKRHLGVGDTISFSFINGTTHVLTVEGIYTKEDLAGPFVVSHALSEQTGTDQFDFSVYVRTAPGVSDAAAGAAITKLTDTYPNAKLQSRHEYIDAQASQIDQLVNLMYGLLGLAVIIALFSIANSMSLSIHERTHEIGLLRAVGMTRRQVRTAIRWEAVMIALLGAAVGVVLGAGFGWAVSVSIRGDGLSAFAMPVRPVLLIVAIALIGGILASTRPARRAARLDVLRAIATE